MSNNIAAASTTAASPSLAVASESIPYGFVGTDIDVDDYEVDSMELVMNPDLMPFESPNSEVANRQHQDATMMVPIIAALNANDSEQPVGASGKRKMRTCTIVRNSKLSFLYDANKSTVTRFWHDDDEVMKPVDDELQLSNPGLLKGWDVEHRERLDYTVDKYYAHPEYEGPKIRSLKKLEEHIKLQNFRNLSVKFKDSAERPRTRHYTTPGAQEARTMRRNPK